MTIANALNKQFLGSGDIVLATAGTFTPTIAFNGASIGATYSVQVGQYTQIGNVIYFFIKLTLTSKGSSTGVAGIYGLPVISGANEAMIGSIDPQSITLNGNGQMVGVVRVASQHINLIYPVTAAATQAYTDADFTNTSDLNISGFYFTT